ncbi:MAG: histidinol-phosphate transaminase [Candidatus Hydrogenedens sp.]|nr:histidinol-phosphate transaminase [Candidatus Hydrogenedens sp.]
MKYQRDILKNVEGYTPGEQPRVPGLIKLNTNENPYPPSPKTLEALHALTLDDLRKYPDPVSLRFREACARHYGVPGPEWVIAGNGMDELLALVLRTFVDPGDVVNATYPTYSLYEVLTSLHGCALEYIDLDDDFQLTDAHYTAQGRLFFLTRPNAPSGVAIPRADVERLCASFPGIVVIDEAYVDFSDDHCLDFPERFENAIVMRTFSKSYGLAGMRVGTAVARPELINEFMKTKDSYNMNAVAQAVGLAAIEDDAYVCEQVGRIRATRERLRKALLELGFSVPDSHTNFLLAYCAPEPGAEYLFQQLRQRNIIVRHFKSRRIDNALRITVGTDEECEALVAALREILAG